MILREEKVILEDLEGVGVKPKAIYSMCLKDQKRTIKGMSEKIKRGDRKKQEKQMRGIIKVRRIGNMNRR
jgi:hypothetical protein